MKWGRGYVFVSISSRHTKVLSKTDVESNNTRSVASLHLAILWELRHKQSHTHTGESVHEAWRANLFYTGSELTTSEIATHKELKCRQLCILRIKTCLFRHCNCVISRWRQKVMRRSCKICPLSTKHKAISLILDVKTAYIASALWLTFARLLCSSLLLSWFTLSTNAMIALFSLCW